jgi:two-component system phosphate regulon sensor histidine kinase PhoR
MSIIDEENKHIERNVEQILQLATLENTNGKNRFEKTDIHKLILEAINAFNMQLQNTGGEIITEFNAAAPYILCNRDQIKNMLQNLIDNAIKYRESEPRITIATYLTAHSFVIQVEDNGIGMSSDTQKYIFERFYRGHSGDRHDVKGFGLGLSYVKYIVDAHKGEIHVKSKPGKGTKFTIYLPQNPEAVI